MSKRVERAQELFSKGYNCAQAVVGAYCDLFGMDEETGLRASAGMGGGMGRLREVCGAVSGMMLALGCRYGSDDPADTAAKREQYARVQELARRFREENGSIVCRELLGLDHSSDGPTPEKRTATYYQKRPCLELVGCAARLLEEYMAEQEN